jgi:hypothetical protein
MEAKTWNERWNTYGDAMMERQRIVSYNRSRRMKKLPLLPVPEKPEKLKVYECYKNGTFEGVVYDIEAVPENMTYKIVDAK